jgi:hypothetical protein
MLLLWLLACCSTANRATALLKIETPPCFIRVSSTAHSRASYVLAKQCAADANRRAHLL